ncbi:MAG TPA: NADH-quinone oxidoreductase subunit J [Acidobacteriota bacterium]|nr:NADH-quinone oxidoreductase subunit J [Acidobacteriota bacterium]
MELIVFYLLAALAVGSALAVVFQRRAVYSALALIICFGAIAALFIQLGAYFIGAVQIIVYAGAIMVLFLFVIMLLDPKTEIFRAKRQGAILIAASPMVVFVAYALIRTLRTGGPAGGLGERGSLHEVARLLFRDYLLPFELTSILILVAVIGAIVLAKRQKD